MGNQRSTMKSWQVVPTDHTGSLTSFNGAAPYAGGVSYVRASAAGSAFPPHHPGYGPPVPHPYRVHEAPPTTALPHRATATDASQEEPQSPYYGGRKGAYAPLHPPGAGRLQIYDQHTDKMRTDPATNRRFQAYGGLPMGGVRDHPLLPGHPLQDAKRQEEAALFAPPFLTQFEQDYSADDRYLSSNVMYLRTLAKQTAAVAALYDEPAEPAPGSFDASKLTPEQFAKYDTNGDGVIDATEMMALQQDIKTGNFNLKKATTGPSSYAYGDVKTELKSGGISLKKAEKPVSSYPYGDVKAELLATTPPTSPCGTSVELAAIVEAIATRMAPHNPRAMSEFQGAAVEQLFDELDVDGDGLVSQSEFHRALTGRRKDRLRDMFGAQNLEWKTVFKNVDADGNGQISLSEFLAACSSTHRVVALDYQYTSC